MRSLTAATLYPGVGLLEFCKISVGRGTDTPFEWIGAPYIDEVKLSAELNAAALPGVSFVPVRFTPDASVFANQECRGVRFVVKDREKLRSIDLGILLATTLHRNHPDSLDLQKMSTLLGDKPTLNAIRTNQPLPKVQQLWTDGLQLFENRSVPHLLYPR